MTENNITVKKRRCRAPPVALEVRRYGSPERAKTLNSKEEYYPNKTTQVLTTSEPHNNAVENNQVVNNITETPQMKSSLALFQLETVRSENSFLKSNIEKLQSQLQAMQPGFYSQKTELTENTLNLAEKEGGIGLALKRKFLRTKWRLR